MIKDQEVLDELLAIKQKIDLLANPIFNDFSGSHFWGNIKDSLEKIIDKINLDKRIYGW